MEGLLLFYLFSLMYCEIVPLEKYGITKSLRDDGLVVLNISEFDEGDSIYITYISYFDYYHNYTYYEFSDIYPENYGIFFPKEKIYSYSEDENPANVPYEEFNYYYYYEFKKPNGNVKYLIMEYNYKLYDGCLEIENTRYHRYFLTIVIFSTIGVAIVLIIIAILIYIFHNKCSCNKSNTSVENKQKITSQNINPGLEIQDIKKNDENNYMVETPYYLIDKEK